jgi:hypothetical protein
MQKKQPLNRIHLQADILEMNQPTNDLNGIFILKETGN